MQPKDELIAEYKRHPFARGLIPFEAGLKFLGSEFARISVEEAGRNRWMIYDKKTKQPAVFCHAGVISSLDDAGTGNYVPNGEDPPSGVERKAIQQRANGKCFYTYIFDTFSDKSLFEGQWKLDAHMSKVKGFNPRSLPRREYLSGHDEKYRNRFWMQTPMFLHKGTDDEPEPDTSHLHPWVTEAVQNSKVFRVNPDRPRVWAMEDGEIIPIGDTEVQRLQRGDVVSMSFRVIIHVTSVNWFPQFHPADVVLLQAGGGAPPDYSAPAMDLVNLPRPSFGPSGETEADWQFITNAVPNPAGQEASHAMEGIAHEGVAISAVGPEGQNVEDMEVDDGGHTNTGTATRIPLQPEDVDVDGFTMLTQGDARASGHRDGFVDVEAEDDGGRSTRGGSVRGSRRKRGNGSVS